MENAGRTPDWLTARRAGLVGCRSCGVVHAAGTPVCRRCGSALASRDDRSLQRVWAWLIAGMVAYVPANVYPMLLTTTLGRTQENTIVGGAIDLAHHGAYAVAAIVFVAGIDWGIRAQGLGGWLASFARPSWVMIPLNLVEQITRTFSLIVRLFGNVMSGVFVVGIVLTLAGLFVPIPLMALDLLTGAVQAYIFAVLATVFIGAAAGEAEGNPSADPTPKKEDPSS